jgi:phenylalanine-4-hydroxylase
MMEALLLSDGGIPDMEKLSDRLEKITGWRVVPVAELVADDVFFNHLANRRFPRSLQISWLLTARVDSGRCNSVS